MLSLYTANVNKKYVKEYVNFFFFLRGGTQERKMTDQVKKNKDIKEDEERLKRQEKKENRKYLHFTFNLFDIHTALRNTSFNI